MKKKNYSKFKQLRLVMTMRRINRNHDRVLYKLALGIFILLVAFVCLCVILQMNWFDSRYPIVPVLVWLCQQPFIGVFFIPFILLLAGVCQFIMFCSKPVTIDTLVTDASTLKMYDDITKRAYDDITEICVNEKQLLVERRQKQLTEELELAKKQNDLKEANMTKITKE